jgi:hypothetical protein
MKRIPRAKWLGIVPALAAGAMLLFPSAGGATPGKSPQWTITLTGTCDGVPAVLIDPPGPGPTAFNTVTGKMGVGRRFQWIYIPTGEIVFQDDYGVALDHANQPNVTCDFPIPPDVSPDGTTNWLFRVTGFFR